MSSITSVGNLAQNTTTNQQNLSREQARLQRRATRIMRAVADGDSKLLEKVLENLSYPVQYIQTKVPCFDPQTGGTVLKTPLEKARELIESREKYNKIEALEKYVAIIKFGEPDEITENKTSYSYGFDGPSPAPATEFDG